MIDYGKNVVTIRDLVDEMAGEHGGRAFLISPDTGRVLTSRISRLSAVIFADGSGEGSSMGTTLLF